MSVQQYHPNYSKLLFNTGSVILGIFGTAHGVFTLYDYYVKLTYFTPVNDEARKQMESTAIKLHPSTNMWRAWLGFNLSHSMGIVSFSLVSIYLANSNTHNALVNDTTMIYSYSIGTSLTYACLANEFWFISPTIGSLLSATCFIASYIIRSKK